MKDMAEQGKAKADLIAWLSSPYELGHPPAEIHYLKTMTYLDLDFYVFRFKNAPADDTEFIGVAGGFDMCGYDVGGHAWSEYDEYTDEETAEKIAFAYIVYVWRFWHDLTA